MHGEGEVALHHERAHQAPEQAEYRAGPEGILDEDQQLAVVVEVEDRLQNAFQIHQTPSPAAARASSWWCVVASGNPTTTILPFAWITSTWLSYSSDRTSVVITSWGVPTLNRPPAR